MLTSESINGNGHDQSVASFRQAHIESQLEELLTVEEVSAILKVPKSWVYEQTRKRGLEKMPHIKLGRYLRFEEKAVVLYVSKHRKNR